MVWEALVGLDNNLKPVPVLAEKWEPSPDAKLWTFKLRQGVMFSDGTPFDADAVVTNIRRHMQISPRPSPYFAMDIRVGYGDLVDVRKVDAHTVTFHLDQPAPAMPATMSQWFSAIFHPKSFAENGDFVDLPLGTGPFRAVEWQRGQLLVLERNSRFRGPAPAVRRIRFRMLPDPNTRVSALIAGEIDGVTERAALLPAQAQQLKAQPGVTVVADPITFTNFLQFNCARSPFEDVRLRRAVALATDLEAIVKGLLLGYGTPGKSLLSPLSAQWFSPKGTPKYDPAEARRLAVSVLGTQRVEATLVYSAAPEQAARPNKAIAELLQSAVRPAGIDLKLQGLEGAAFNDRSNRGDYDLRLTQISWGNGDPDFLMDRFLKSTGQYQATLKGGYKNPDADQLVAAGKIERDEKKRFAIYERLQEIGAQDVPLLPLYHEHSLTAHRNTITGLRQHVTFQPTLDTMKLIK
jgi:peptide/nickel transport system substrate-binding protein